MITIVVSIFAIITGLAVIGRLEYLAACRREANKRAEYWKTRWEYQQDWSCQSDEKRVKLERALVQEQRNVLAKQQIIGLLNGRALEAIDALDAAKEALREGQQVQ